MPTCSVCGNKKMTMDKCDKCKNHFCKEHIILSFTNLRYEAGRWAGDNVNLCWKCANINPPRVVDWKRIHGIEYCVYCGEDTKVDYRSEWKLYPFPILDQQKRFIFCQSVVCNQCGRVYSEYYFMFDATNNRLLPLPNQFVPKSPQWGRIYAIYADGLKAQAAGRYENAGAFFEQAGFVEKAKKVRDSARVIHHEHKHVSIDVNEMIKTLSDTNFVIPYKCPSCGATIKVSKDRPANTFLTCDYCHSSLKAIDIQTLISQLI